MATDWGAIARSDEFLELERSQRRFTVAGLTVFFAAVAAFLLLVGYVYILKKGLFEWGARARTEAEAEARALELKESRERATRPAVAASPARAA